MKSASTEALGTHRYRCTAPLQVLYTGYRVHFYDHIRAKVEHPFRVLKQQFGYVKVRYRGLKKSTAQIVTLFALSNLWMVRYKLLAMGQVHARGA
ncbi:transposase [Acidovorax sp. K2F]|uniref:transposase n=1 Tax=Acidovorax sp. K2F TaxID=2978125 RepID=UPI0021B12D7D|nr:transposase [Acidovorax sp. K2F]MCT6720807.1 transposase [Acidovorax sp. K2F]